MMLLSIWLANGMGCAWIPADEHAKNHKALEQLLDADSDADADADSDSDTDTDTDSDSDPIPDCVDDAQEENDTLLTARELAPPLTVDASMCPDDLPPGGEIPIDLWSVQIGQLDVLRAALRARGETSCAEQGLTMTITDEDGNPFPDAVTSDPCGELEVGWGPGQYLIWLTGDPDADPTVQNDYALEISVGECYDVDQDGFLSGICGGPDCSDLESDRYPGAIDNLDLVTGKDQDCDGGDDLASVCQVITTGSGFVEGSVPCGDLEEAPVWDRWEVFINLDEEVSVLVQNNAIGQADPIALLVTSDGSTHYGLDGQMDNEVDCQTTAWSGEITACPGACITLPSGGRLTAGDLTIWVAQHPGEGCTDANYQVLVLRQGNPALPILVGDNVALEYPAD